MADNNSLLEKIEWYTQEGERYFQAICASSSFPDFREAFYQYLLCRFMIREDSKENNLLKLALRSNDENVPKAHRGSNSDILHTYDCLHTDLVVRKKTLFIMHMEKKLGVRLDDDMASDVETVDELAKALWVQFSQAGIN